jgi:hypothetical protein
MLHSTLQNMLLRRIDAKYDAFFGAAFDLALTFAKSEHRREMSGEERRMSVTSKSEMSPQLIWHLRCRAAQLGAGVTARALNASSVNGSSPDAVSTGARKFAAVWPFFWPFERLFAAFLRR